MPAVGGSHQLSKGVKTCSPAALKDNWLLAEAGCLPQLDLASGSGEDQWLCTGLMHLQGRSALCMLCCIQNFLTDPA